MADCDPYISVLHSPGTVSSNQPLSTLNSIRHVLLPVLQLTYDNDLIRYSYLYLTTAPQLLNMSAAYAGETQAYTDNINSFVVNRKPPPSPCPVSNSLGFIRCSSGPLSLTHVPAWSDSRHV